MLPLCDENPTTNRPIVTVALILVCIFAYFGPSLGESDNVNLLIGQDQQTLSTTLGFQLEYAAIPCEITNQRPLTQDEITKTYFTTGDSRACESTDTSSPFAFPDKSVISSLFTSMVLHGSILHLALNVLFLWVFGNNVEDRLGHLGFLAFFLVAGVVSAVGLIVSQPDGTLAVIGASGAVAGVMGAYLIWYPDAPIRTLLFLILVDIRARWFLLGWFAFQFFTATGGGAAWVTHVVGFAFGVIVGRLVRKFQPRLRALTGQRVPAWDETGGAGHGPYPHLDEVWVDPHPEAYGST